MTHDRTGLCLPTKQNKAGRKASGWEVVYLLHAEGTRRFKIGATKDLFRRHKEIQSGSPVFLDVVALWYPKRDSAFVVEAAMHEYVDEALVFGEWYEFTADPLLILDPIAKRFACARLTLEEYTKILGRAKANALADALGFRKPA